MKTRNYILIACALLFGVMALIAPFPSFAYAHEIGGADGGADDGADGGAYAPMALYTLEYYSPDDVFLFEQHNSTGNFQLKNWTPPAGFYLWGWTVTSQGSHYGYSYNAGSPFSTTEQYVSFVAVIFPLYTVTFNSQGGSAVSPQQVADGTSINAPTPPTRDGYTFDGWYSSSSGGTKQTFPFTVTANKTLYAHWIEDITYYTVTFNSQGGSAVSPQQVADGTSINAPTPPTKSGYTFDGWYSSSSGGTKQTFPFTVTANKTLYAHWDEIPITYTITFSSGGGSYISPINVNAGDSISNSPLPVKNGFTFLGWFTSSGSSGVKIDFPYTPTSNVTFYGKWESIIPIHTVSFHANYGFFSTGLPQFVLNVEQGSFVYTPPTPSRKGFTFLGWFTAPIGGEEVAFPYLPLNHITLYAHWAEYEPFDGGFEALLRQVFSAFDTISQIEIFPNISIGILIGFPLILAAIFIFIKLLRG